MNISTTSQNIFFIFTMFYFTKSRLIAFFFENYIFWNTIADSFDGLRLISEILQFCVF